MQLLQIDHLNDEENIETFNCNNISIIDYNCDLCQVEITVDNNLVTYVINRDTYDGLINLLARGSSVVINPICGITGRESKVSVIND